MNFMVLLIIVLSIIKTDGFFGGGIAKIKEKAKQMYQKNYGKSKTWHFLGHDLSEYPGTNAEYRKINEEKWQEYYKCLEEQNRNLGEHLSVAPEAILGFEGNYVNMECKICLSPKELQSNAIEWYWSGLKEKHLSPIETDENIFISPNDKVLHLYNLKAENTGQYICKLGSASTAPYFLTVINYNDSDFKEVHSLKAAKGPYPQEMDFISEYNLIIDSIWGEWSTCSTCETIGRRHRLGYCLVYVDFENKIVDFLFIGREKAL